MERERERVREREREREEHEEKISSSKFRSTEVCTSGQSEWAERERGRELSPLRKREGKGGGCRRGDAMRSDIAATEMR